MNSILIVGAGGHAKVVIDAITGANKFITIKLLEQESSQKLDLMGYPIFKNIQETECNNFHVAIGNNQIRKDLLEKYLAQHFIPVSIIHPKASISEHSVIGKGTFIASLAIIGPATALGQGVIINHGAIIDHDVKIGNFTHVASNVTLGGNVTIGNNCLIGAGATVLPDLTISDDTIIGAGAVVTKSITRAGQYIGIPAKAVN